MDERDLRGLIDRVKAGGLSRRGFVRRMAAVGLAAPLATQLRDADLGARSWNRRVLPTISHRISSALPSYARGKPAPDIYLHAAQAIGHPADASSVISHMRDLPWHPVFMFK